MAEDPEKLIIGWCDHLAPPRLIDEKAYDACHSCQKKFGGFLSKVERFHCRLCGHMYCGACTAKYHIPLIFRTKGKEGPERVCMSCVEGCLAEKAKSMVPSTQGDTPTKPAPAASSLRQTMVGASVLNMARNIEITPPEVWEEETNFVACPKCSTKKCKTHNCRVCGLLFCEKCTSKMAIPAFFERKKDKVGASRVCDACRYRIVNGARLVEKASAPRLGPGGVPFGGAPSTSNQSMFSTYGGSNVSMFSTIGGSAVPPSMFSTYGGVSGGTTNNNSRVTPTSSRRNSLSRSVAPEHSRRSSKGLTCNQPGCTAQAVLAGRCATHNTESKPAEPVSIPTAIKREGSDEVIAKILVPSPDSTLASIDVMFKKSVPQTDNYSYIFRGQPIPDVFMEVFRAKQLGSLLIIRTKKTHLIPHIESSFSLNDTSIDNSSNPFLMANDRTSSERRAKEKLLEEERSKKSRKPVFKKPTIRGGGNRSQLPIAPPKPKAKVPPLPPGASGLTLTPGASIDDVCKMRAKRLFGAV